VKALRHTLFVVGPTRWILLLTFAALVAATLVPPAVNDPRREARVAWLAYETDAVRTGKERLSPQMVASLGIDLGEYFRESWYAWDTCHWRWIWSLDHVADDPAPVWYGGHSSALGTPGAGRDVPASIHLPVWLSTLAGIALLGALGAVASHLHRSRRLASEARHGGSASSSLG
jgi:hypothetical protein